MAPSAKIDRVDDLNATEEDGVVTRLLRKIRVVDLSSTDYTVLFTALNTLGISPQSKLPGTSLVLRQRNPKLVDEDKATVDVELVYEHEAKNSGQSFSNPASGIVLGQVQVSVNQVRTNTDRLGEVVTVRHTWPHTDDTFADKTSEQSLDFDFFQPQSRRIYKGRVSTQFPWILERAIIGKINANPWMGFGTSEWMCTGCDWEPVDGTAFIYEFSFEFQHNPDGWNPQAFFIDPRTGRPPPGLVEGVGYKTVDRHVPADFETVIGARLQGG